MTTQNVLDLGLSGSTGTVHFVGSTSPTILTPLISGITSGSQQSAGYVGQVIESDVATNTVSLSSNTAVTITSISLTAGNWLINGNVAFSPTGTTVVTGWSVAINSTNNTLPDTRFYSGFAGVNQIPQTFFGNAAVPICVSLSTTTTYYIVGLAIFNTSTLTAGGSIVAVRIS